MGKKSVKPKKGPNLDDQWFKMAMETFGLVERFGKELHDFQAKLLKYLKQCDGYRKWVEGQTRLDEYAVKKK